MNPIPKSSFTVITWRCPRCGGYQTTNAGCQVTFYKGRKVRICPACVKDREAKQADKQTSSVVTEDLTITTREDLPPIPKGFPAPTKLKYHG